MPQQRTDAQLVTAFTAGDRGALAEIYDRFSAGLYDTAAAMLRDRHEAADAMQDVFLIAAERMGQLREPDRLKPWLYAILRNEVYRRSKKRGRALPTDFSAMGAPEMAAPTAPDADGEALAAAELAALVRSAACGLDERDQLVLELSVRQGLQGADLAAALGVTAEQSYTVVHRMRDRVERSLGALVVARAGRKDCPELADVLKGWNGEFSVLVRKRVARHIERCDVCDRTRRTAAPIALMGAAPAFAAPIMLRDRILARAGTPGIAPAPAYTFDPVSGFPRPLRSTRLPAILAGTVLAIVIGGAALVAANATGDDGDPAAAPPPAVTSAKAPSTVPSNDTVTAPASTTITTTATTLPSTTLPSTTLPATSVAPTTVPVVTVRVTTPPPPPAPGALDVSLTTVDLGATTGSSSFDVTNTGGTPIIWAADGTVFPFTLVGAGGTLQPGASQTVTVVLDRARLAEGNVQATVLLTAPGVDATQVELRARVERAPALTLVAGPAGTLPACQWSSNITVGYTDESAIRLPATVHWAGPLNGNHQLNDNGGSSVVGSIPMVNPLPGAYVYTVTVTDVRGNVATVSGNFTIDPCPG